MLALPHVLANLTCIIPTSKPSVVIVCKIAWENVESFVDDAFRAVSGGGKAIRENRSGVRSPGRTNADAGDSVEVILGLAVLEGCFARKINIVPGQQRLTRRTW